MIDKKLCKPDVSQASPLFYQRILKIFPRVARQESAQDPLEAVSKTNAN